MSIELTGAADRAIWDKREMIAGGIKENACLIRDVLVGERKKPGKPFRDFGNENHPLVWSDTGRPTGRRSMPEGQEKASLQRAQSIAPPADRPGAPVGIQETGGGLLHTFVVSCIKCAWSLSRVFMQIHEKHQYLSQCLVYTRLSTSNR